MSPATADGLLSGVRLLDLTNVLAGPYCAYQFAHLGADVIKVEAPGRRRSGAQPWRRSGPEPGREGASFLAQNPGKRSMVLDLKNSGDRDRFLSLADSADALVENFRPGVMDRPELEQGHFRQQVSTYLLRNRQIRLVCWFHRVSREWDRGAAGCGTVL